ncbi:MAG: phosphatidylserine decarboxylase [Chromatiaceae bacterium]|nr:MAG: phosphatidylserine decarboxylase [Chromatiaceae bacterium]
MHKPSSAPPGRLARLWVACQRLLPQHALSALMYRLTRLRLGPLTTLTIRAFVAAFRVDLAAAAEPRAAAYPSFNAFFTRALHADARPLPAAGAALVCPVDGCISQCGPIRGGQLIQAKGQTFGLAALLGGDTALAARFDAGDFATLYLSPRDYHRIHMPCDGQLQRTLHVPGRLFSVNRTTAALVPGLYARNERLVCVFASAAGPLVLVLVGAIFVGGIETVWTGPITPPRGRQLQARDCGAQGPILARGAELGRFNMGSTVILLTAPGQVDWAPGLAPGVPVRCRASLGRLTGVAG